MAAKPSVSALSRTVFQVHAGQPSVEKLIGNRGDLLRARAIAGATARPVPSVAMNERRVNIPSSCAGPTCS